MTIATAFARFGKRWASTGTAAEPSDNQADTGLAFLGANAPTFGLHNAMFQWNDDKDNWLYSRLSEVMSAGGVTPTSAGSNQLLTAMRSLFGGTGTLSGNGYMRYPGGVIEQWGVVNSPTPNPTIVLPIAFPTRIVAIVCTEQNAIGWGNPPEPTVFGVSYSNLGSFTAYATRIQTTGLPVYQSTPSFGWRAIGY